MRGRDRRGALAGLLRRSERGLRLRRGGAGKCQRGSGQFAESRSEFFPDAGDEAAVRVDDQHGERALTHHAEGTALGVEGEGGNLAEAEFGGGILHGIEHSRRCRAHGNKVETLRNIVRGNHEIAVRENAGSDAGERAAEFDDSTDGEFFLG